MRNKEIWKPGFDRATRKFVDTDLQKPLQLPRCAYTSNHHIRDYLLAVFTRLRSFAPLVRASHLLGAAQKLKRIKELYQSLSHPADETLRPHSSIKIVEEMQRRAARNLDYFPQLKQCSSSMRQYIASPDPTTADEEAELTRQLTAISHDAEAAMTLTREAATARKALVKTQFSGNGSVYTVVRICLASVNDSNDWEWRFRHAHAQHICNIVGRERQPGQFSNASNLLSMTDEYPAFSRMLQYLTTGKYKAEAFAALQAAIDKEKLLRNQLCPAERHLLIFTPDVLMELFRNEKANPKISISEQCEAIRRQADLEASILASWKPALVEYYRAHPDKTLGLFVSDFFQQRVSGAASSRKDIEFTISNAFRALFNRRVRFQYRILSSIPRLVSQSIFDICMESTRHVRFIEVMRLIDPDAQFANANSCLMIDAPRQPECTRIMSSRHEQLLQSSKFEFLPIHCPSTAMCKDFVTFLFTQLLRNPGLKHLSNNAYIELLGHEASIIFNYITSAKGSIADVHAVLTPMMAREQRLYLRINSKLGQQFRSKFGTAWGISEELTAKSILRTLPVCRSFVTQECDSDVSIVDALDQVLAMTFQEQQHLKAMSGGCASFSGAHLFELLRDWRTQHSDLLSQNHVALQGCEHCDHLCHGPRDFFPKEFYPNKHAVFLTTAGRVACFKVADSKPWNLANSQDFHSQFFHNEFPARSPSMHEVGIVSGYYAIVSSKRAEQNRRKQEQNFRQQEQNRRQERQHRRQQEQLEEQNRRQQAKLEKDRHQEAYAARVEEYQARLLKISRKPLTRWEKLVKAGKSKQTN
jgi:hypothetical protein